MHFLILGRDTYLEYDVTYTRANGEITDEFLELIGPVATLLTVTRNSQLYLHGDEFVHIHALKRLDEN